MIAINFATVNYRVMDRLVKILAAASLFLAAVLAVIFWSVFSLQSEIRTRELQVRELESGETAIRPLLIERDRITKDLSSMSVLMDARRFSWTRLLTGMEKVTPPGVALNRLEYNPRNQVLSLYGTAQSPESLRNLMVALERATQFREPYLKHQALEKGIISFNVVASYR